MLILAARQFLERFLETKRVESQQKANSSSTASPHNHLQIKLQKDSTLHASNSSNTALDTTCMEALQNLILITSYACTSSNKNSDKFRDSFAKSPNSIFLRPNEIDIETKSSLQYPLRPARVVVYEFCTRWKQPIWTKDALIGLALYWAILCLLLSNKNASELENVEMIDSLRDADPKVRAMVEEAIEGDTKQSMESSKIVKRTQTVSQVSSISSEEDINDSADDDDDGKDDEESNTFHPPIKDIEYLFDAIEWLLSKERFFDNAVQMSDDLMRNMSVSQAKHIENSTTYMLFSRLKRSLKTHMKNPLMWTVVISTSSHTDLCHMIHSSVMAQQQSTDAPNTSFSNQQLSIQTLENCIQRRVKLAEERCCLLDLKLLAMMCERYPMVGIISDVCNNWTPLAIASAYRGPSVFNHNLQKQTPLSDGCFVLSMCHLLSFFSVSSACIADRNGLLPLHHAARKGHSVVMQYLLRTFPYSAAIRDLTNKFPLHHALLSASQHDESHVIELASIYPRILQTSYDWYRGKGDQDEKYMTGCFNIFAYLEKHCSTSLCFALKQFVRDGSPLKPYTKPSSDHPSPLLQHSKPSNTASIRLVGHFPSQAECINGDKEKLTKQQKLQEHITSQSSVILDPNSINSNLKPVDIRPAVESLLMLLCSASSQREPSMTQLQGIENRNVGIKRKVSTTTIDTKLTNSPLLVKKHKANEALTIALSEDD